MSELIDREAVREFIKSYRHSTDVDFHMEDHLDEIPTINAVPVVHGAWIFNPADGIEAMFTNPKCSLCGFESADGLNYCPNCGAKMEVQDDRK